MGRFIDSAALITGLQKTSFEPGPESQFFVVNLRWVIRHTVSLFQALFSGNKSNNVVWFKAGSSF